MQIEALRIHNFRVFQDVTVENIPQMAVFMGQNGAGKTTFFDVFGFLLEELSMKYLLLELCKATDRPVLIRIACQELESWYFGDTGALARAYEKPKLKNLSKQKKYRVPDEIPSPKEELYKLIPEHQQIEGARRIAPNMDIENNTSVSFRFFVKGVQCLAAE